MPPPPPLSTDESRNGRRGLSYLIGPELFPAFSALLKLCFGTLAVLFVIGMISNMAGILSDPIGAGRLVFQAFTGLIDTAFRVLGILVLIFAVIERLARPAPPEPSEPSVGTQPAFETTRASKVSALESAAGEVAAAAASAQAAVEEAVAEVEQLDKTDDPDRISRTAAAFHLAFVLLALVVLNFFPLWIGGWIGVDGELGFVPLAGPGFERWLWLLYLVLTVAFVRNVIHFKTGRWSVLTRGLDILESVIGLVWVYHLFKETAVVQVDAEWMLAEGWTQAAVDKLQDLVDGILGTILHWCLLAGIVFTGIDIAKKAKRLYSTARRAF